MLRCKIPSRRESRLVLQPLSSCPELHSVASLHPQSVQAGIACYTNTLGCRCVGSTFFCHSVAAALTSTGTFYAEMGLGPSLPGTDLTHLFCLISCVTLTATTASWASRTPVASIWATASTAGSLLTQTRCGSTLTVLSPNRRPQEGMAWGPGLRWRTRETLEGRGREGPDVSGAQGSARRQSRCPTRPTTTTTEITAMTTTPSRKRSTRRALAALLLWMSL